MWIGTGFCAARDAIARGLVAVGATPNVVTFAGFLATCGAGVCFAVGAGCGGWLPVIECHTNELHRWTKQRLVASVCQSSSS